VAGKGNVGCHGAGRIRAPAPRVGGTDKAGISAAAGAGGAIAGDGEVDGRGWGLVMVRPPSAPRACLLSTPLR
jgi:hypothetical protein